MGWGEGDGRPGQARPCRGTAPQREAPTCHRPRAGSLPPRCPPPARRKQPSRACAAGPAGTRTSSPPPPRARARAPHWRRGARARPLTPPALPRSPLIPLSAHAPFDPAGSPPPPPSPRTCALAPAPAPWRRAAPHTHTHPTGPRDVERRRRAPSRPSSPTPPGGRRACARAAVSPPPPRPGAGAARLSAFARGGACAVRAVGAWRAVRWGRVGAGRVYIVRGRGGGLPLVPRPPSELCAQCVCSGHPDTPARPRRTIYY